MITLTDNKNIIDLHVVHTISKQEFENNYDGLENVIKHLLQQSLAKNITDNYIDKIEKEHSVDFRIDCYLVKKDFLWQLIEEKAKEISFIYSNKN